MSIAFSVLFGLWIEFGIAAASPAQSAYKAQDVNLNVGCEAATASAHRIPRASRFDMAQTGPARYIVTWSYHSLIVLFHTPNP